MQLPKSCGPARPMLKPCWVLCFHYLLLTFHSGCLLSFDETKAKLITTFHPSIPPWRGITCTVAFLRHVLLMKCWKGFQASKTWLPCNRNTLMIKKNWSKYISTCVCADMDFIWITLALNSKILGDPRLGTTIQVDYDFWMSLKSRCIS